MRLIIVVVGMVLGTLLFGLGVASGNLWSFGAGVALLAMILIMGLRVGR
jgi:hypothetical protein